MAMSTYPVTDLILIKAFENHSIPIVHLTQKIVARMGLIIGSTIFT